MNQKKSIRCLKKMIAIALCAAMITGASAILPAGTFADSMTVAAVSESDFSVSEKSDGTVKITGYSGSDTQVSIPSTIGDKTVSEIDKNVFGSSVTYLFIPSGVTSIHSYAFDDCSNLETISVSSSNTSFCAVNGVLFNKDKTKLVRYPSGKTNTSYTIPGYVETIGNSAFYNVGNVKNIVMPQNVTSVDSWNFSSVTKIFGKAGSYAETYANNNSQTFVDIGDYLLNISNDDTISITGYTGSDTSLTIPSAFGGMSVTAIGYEAFRNCDGLTSVTIQNGITTIGENAFRDCYKLTNVTIPDSVTSIGYGAFENCDGMSSVTIPNGVTSIGGWAFSYCDNLTSVTIPGSVTSIGERVFAYSRKLTNIAVDTSNANYTSADGILFNKNKTTLIRYPAGKTQSSYNIPSNVTKIDSGAFESCSGLTSLTIPGSVASIGYEAFRNCDGLTSVTIPNGVTSIGGLAFYNCDGLTSLTIPGSVAAIGYYSFASCDKLTSVTMLNGVTTIGSEAFCSCSKLTSVTIPSSVTSIGSWAFEYCGSLTSIYIPESVTSISSSAFNGHNSDLVILGKAGSAAETFANNQSITFKDVSSLSTSTTYTSGDYKYKVNSDYTATITEYTGSASTLTIPSTLDNLKVTSIGYDAFEDCDGLTSVTIPNGVTSIGGWAFSYCDNLTSVTIPDSVTSIGERAFSYCDNLTSVTIPGSVTSIGERVFANSTKLTSIAVDANNANYASEDGILFNKNKTTLIRYPAGKTQSSYNIPSNVTKIDSGAFKSCSGLTSVTIPDSVTSIGYEAFEDCDGLTSVTIPGSVTSIGNYAFEDCDGLTSVTIPNGVTSIGGGAFYNCDGLTSVTMLNGVTTIGSEAFCSCSKLTSVTIPGSVTSIGGWAFSYCDNLTSVTIPGSVTSIGERVFAYSRKLTNIAVDTSNANYTSADGILFNKNKTTLIRYPAGKTQSSYNIPSNVTKIDSGAFESCSGLTSLTIPSSVTSIGDYAFKDCDGLTSLTIPGSVAAIGYYSFASCDKLTSVTMLNGVTTIGSEAFCSCSKLTSVTIPSSVTSIGSYAFEYCGSLTSIYIPESVTSISSSAFNDHNSDLVILGKAGSAAETFANNQSITFKDVSSLSTSTTYTSGDYKYKVNSDYTVTITEYTGSASTLTIPSTLDDLKVTSIGYEAFDDCDGLTSVTIPNGVTSIGGWAFSHCDNLTSVTIPGSVTSIGERVFAYSRKLTNIAVDTSNANYTSADGILFNKNKTTLIRYPAGKTQSSYNIPSNVTKIDSGAFESCSGLTSVTIPSSVTSIGDYAFRDCDGLTSVTIPSSVTSIGDYAFRDCDGLTSLTIPGSVTSIGDYAFRDCDGLTSLTIPGSVAAIGYYSFASCDKLTSVTMLNGVTTIGSEAFCSCSKLTSVTIPSSVTSIGSWAFEYCGSLTSIYIPESVTSISSSAFNGHNSNLVINGKTGSAAEQFANANNITFFDPSAVIPMSSCTITVPYVVYTPSANQPQVTVSYNGTQLVQGTDYTVTYRNNTAAGTAEAVVTAKSARYSGSVTKSFTISRRPITDSVVTKSIGTLDKDSTEPPITLTHANTTLVRNTDYQVSTSIDQSGENMIVTLTGIGSYSGTYTKSVALPVKDISRATVTFSKDAYGYTGNAKTPLPTVQFNNNTLVKGQDYTVNYENNIHAGTAKVTITGINDYGSSAVAYFTITPQILSKKNITLGTSSFTYNGTEKKPTVTVKNSQGTVLTLDTDYTISYYNNVNAGTNTASVRVTGMGDYTAAADGTTANYIEITYTINPKPVSASTVRVTLSAASKPYTGNAQTVAVTLYDTVAKRTLTKGRDYTLTFKNNVNVGTATVQINGAGNYSGSRSSDFEITAVPISSANLTLSKTSFAYSGNAKTPTAVLEYNGRTLTKNVDYTVEYRNNINAGTAQAVITGKGSFSGTRTESFVINPKSVGSSSVTLGTTSYTYDGTEKTPAASVTDNGIELTEGKDYSVSYRNNIHVGQDDIVPEVVIEGIGNYRGQKISTFTILPRTISKANIKLGGVTYTGNPKYPSITMMFNNMPVDSSNYTLKYENNINAGTNARVTFIGKGDFKGTVTKTFTISRKPIGGTTIHLNPSTFRYSGSANQPEVEITHGTRTLKNGTDYRIVEYKNNIAAGKGSVVIEGLGNYCDRKEKLFVINQKEISKGDATLNAYTFAYTGSAIKPVLTVKVDGKLLKAGTDYKITGYSDNVNVGKAALTLEGINNYKGTVTKNYNIKAAALDISWVKTTPTVTFNGAEQKPTGLVMKNGSKTLVPGTDYQITGYSNNINAGQGLMTVKGMNNYSGTLNVPFDIVSKSINGSAIKVTLNKTSYGYQGNAKKPTPTVYDGSRLLEVNKDYTVDYLNNVNAGTASVIIKGTNNYCNSRTVNFTITPMDISSRSITLEHTDYTYTGTAITPVVTVKGLTENTDYRVDYVNNINAGTAVAAITGLGNYNGTAQAEFTIDKRSMEDVMVTLSSNSMVYTGTKRKPVPTVKYGTLILQENTDYTVKYANAVNVSTKNPAVITIIAAENSNFTGSTTRNYKITPKPADNAIIEVEKAVYDGEPQTPNFVVRLDNNSLLNGTDYTFKYTDNNINAGSQAEVTVTFKGNYSGSKTQTFTIDPQSIDPKNITITSKRSYPYQDGEPVCPEIKVNLATDEGNVELIQDVDYEVTYSNNVNRTSQDSLAVIQVEGKGNYSFIATKTFAIT